LNADTTGNPGCCKRAGAACIAAATQERATRRGEEDSATLYRDNVDASVFARVPEGK